MIKRLVITLFIICNTKCSFSQEICLFKEDFSQKLNSWEKIKEGEEQGSFMTIAITEEGVKHPHVVEFKREDARYQKSKVGIEKIQKIDLLKFDRFIFKADVKVIYSSLNKDSWVGPAHPLTLEIQYIDLQGFFQTWKQGIVYAPCEINYPDISMMIPKNEWYTYTSENLMEILPRPVQIKKISIYGSGVNFWSRVDNIELRGIQSVASDSTMVSTVKSLGTMAQSSILIPQKSPSDEAVDSIPASNEPSPDVIEAIAPEPTLSEEFLISNIFVETDLREALAEIAINAGISIIPDDDVQGVISMGLKEVSLERALKMLLTPGGYVFNKINDYYVITSPDPKSRSYQAIVKMYRYKPRYLKAKDLVGILPPFYAEYVKTDVESNTVVITTVPEIANKLLQEFAAIDQPITKQVLIEVLVTELSEGVEKNLGIKWLWQNEDSKVERTSVTTPELNIGYLKSGFSEQISMTLDALIERGQGTVRANPNIVTLEAKEATIFMGTEEYFRISGDVYNRGNLERISTGILLKVTPYIGDGGEITLELNPEVSDVVSIGIEGLPIVSKRNVRTTVRVKDGETITIGGLVREREEKRVSKVPILGSLPVIGFFFNHIHTDNVRTKVYIFITPHIIVGGEIGGS